MADTPLDFESLMGAAPQMPSMPPAIPQAPGLQSFLPKPGLADKIAPIAAIVSALALGAKRGGAGLATGFAQGQQREHQNQLQQATLLEADAQRQQAMAQQASDRNYQIQRQQQIAQQQDEQRRMQALATVKQRVSAIKDPKQYDQEIEAYAQMFQQAGFRGMTPNQLRVVAPFVAPSAKSIAADAVSNWLKNDANKELLKKDPSIVSKVTLRIDTNGDDVAENVPLLRAGEIGGIQFATDQSGQFVGAVESKAKVGSAFQETLQAKRARFLADNKREPTPKEQEQLIQDSLKQESAAQRKPEDVQEVDPSRVASTAQAILEHRMAPSQLSLGGGSMGKSPFRQAVVAEVNRMNPRFNWQEAESNYQFGKSTGTQTTVRFLDNIEKTLPVLEQASDAFQRSGVRVINKAMLAGKSQFGSVDVVKFEFARNILADEIAKILQGGGTGAGTTDAKLRQAQELLAGDMTPQQLKAVTASARELLGARRQSLTQGTYMERPEGAAAAPDTGAKATGAAKLNRR